MGFFDLSGQETVNTGPFGDMPILVLSHDLTIDRSDGLSAIADRRIRREP
jgi:hypothetical protein